jgi:hypothetical protein
LTESLPKVMFSKNKQDSHLMIYCQQILTILGLISSFHHYFHLNVSHRTFLHNSSLCSHANIHILKFLTLLYMNLYEDIVEIIVKYNKNIRRVEWMTSHPLQNAFSLNWARLMEAVKLANKNRKKVRKMNEFCLEIL